MAAADKVVIVVVTPEFLVVVIDPVVVVVVLPISPVAPESKIKLSLNQSHAKQGALGMSKFCIFRQHDASIYGFVC